MESYEAASALGEPVTTQMVKAFTAAMAKAKRGEHQLFPPACRGLVRGWPGIVAAARILHRGKDLWGREAASPIGCRPTRRMTLL
jgi:hypothetical protein